MKRFLILTFLWIGTILHAQTDSQKEILQKFYTKYNTHQSISYDIYYKMKFFDEDEPIHINSHVDIVKSQRDTIFKEVFLYNRKDSLFDIHKYYKPDSLFVIDHKDRIVTIFDASKGEISPITGNVDGNVIDVAFKEAKKMRRNLIYSKNKITYRDSLNYLKILIEYPDDEDYYGAKKSYIIDKQTLAFIQINYEARYKDQIQTNQWLLSNVVFDNVIEQDLSNKVNQYFKEYQIEKFVGLTEKDYELIPNGQIAPNLKGVFYPDYTKEIKLSIDKVTILDFWYTSCMPCIKVIPHLNKLKQKYQDKIQIIGVNPVENKANQKERIDKFLNRTPIDYPIMLIEEGEKEYNVRAYPTLYIVDENNKVIYSSIGASEDTYEELDTFLSEFFK